ncbi:uncharacterized protein LTR77_000698 [Saxophila tyrrhenica]|uniref:Uncharacterized protein n=1 Tax=Saxophila tyrrhenica TaxID=1690608 RepID=A0AAV9PNR0_9PEZI|nr:hypothetical protein LTR77_000698 [Saxophila tyrrhenica]
METYSSVYPTTPQTQTSHMRSSQYSNPAKAATRALQQQSESQQNHLSAPTSQESIASYQSAASSTQPRLQTSSSNASQLTGYTDVTSPITSLPEQGDGGRFGASKPLDRRMRTPEESNMNGMTGDSYAVTSPMSVASPPSVNGTKRTASGHVKNAPSLPSTPLTTGRPRGESTSSTSSRAGELARDLKTRLGYAMAKVQNGWEHRNIHEVEQLAAHKVYSTHRHSMSHSDSSRRPISAGLTNGTANLSMNGYIQNSADHPSKRHSGHYTTHLPSSSQPTPRLQPAPDIRPTAQHSLSQPLPYANPTHTSAMSPPRTPTTTTTSQTRPRPATLRTETQTAEAERDALQALFQLGSPHASQQAFSGAVRSHSYQNGNGSGHGYSQSQASSSQASPLRSEFGFVAGTPATPRRVTFARSESDVSSSSAQMEGKGEGEQVEVR